MVFYSDHSVSVVYRELSWLQTGSVGNTLNRIFQVNECEGKYRRILCVCSAGILRSATAAVVLSQPPYSCNTRACGSKHYALIPASQALVEWSEEIVCMKEEHLKDLSDNFYGVENFVILDIDDRYDYRQPELIELIKKRYDAVRKIS